MAKIDQDQGTDLRREEWVPVPDFPPKLSYPAKGERPLGNIRKSKLLMTDDWAGLSILRPAKIRRKSRNIAPSFGKRRKLLDGEKQRTKQGQKNGFGPERVHIRSEASDTSGVWKWLGSTEKSSRGQSTGQKGRQTERLKRMFFETTLPTESARGSNLPGWTSSRGSAKADRAPLHERPLNLGDFWKKSKTREDDGSLPAANSRIKRNHDACIGIESRLDHYHHERERRHCSRQSGTSESRYVHRDLHSDSASKALFDPMDRSDGMTQWQRPDTRPADPRDHLSVEKLGDVEEVDVQSAQGEEECSETDPVQPSLDELVTGGISSFSQAQDASMLEYAEHEIGSTVSQRQQIRGPCQAHISATPGHANDLYQPSNVMRDDDATIALSSSSSSHMANSEVGDGQREDYDATPPEFLNVRNLEEGMARKCRGRSVAGHNSNGIGHHDLTSAKSFAFTRPPPFIGSVYQPKAPAKDRHIYASEKQRKDPLPVDPVDKCEGIEEIEE